MSIGFDYIYREYYDKLYRFSVLYLRDDLVAEDMAVEALCKLWDVMKKENIENIEALLFKILKNKILDYLKKQNRENNMKDSLGDWQARELQIRISTLEECFPSDLYLHEIQDILTKTLERLPTQTEAIFRLSRFENKSGKEIAEEMNITVKGVDYHLSKALKLLRITLKDYLPFF